jgi:hypothetical protein
MARSEAMMCSAIADAFSDAFFRKDVPMFLPPRWMPAVRSAGRAFACAWILLGFGFEDAGAVQGVKVPIEGSDLYYLRYSDDLISVNDRCPVRKSRLGERMPPVLVNGKVIGFC